MTRNVLLAAVAALLVVTAGCTGAPVESSATPTDASGTDQASTGGGGTDDTRQGRVNFYVSDEPNDIEDFAHLNVTVTKVGFHRGGENGSWIERPVDDRTVDLTRLRGANATKLGTFDLPNGTYTKVFIYVSDVEGTLNASGENATVKLPSGKIQLNEPFELGNGSEVDFVFDVTVHQAGKSGKYVLKPVVGESGTDVPIESVDEGEGDHEDERADDGEAAPSLDAAFVGNVTRGENATVLATRGGEPVENATVLVDGEAVGATNATGHADVAVPADAESLSVTVVDGDDEAELEVEFEESGDGDEAAEATPTATATATETSG